MWNIIDKKAYKLALNKNLELKLKIFEKQDGNAVYVNYKGYNIVFAMEVWGVGAECKEWEINEKMVGDPVKDIRNVHFLVDKSVTNAFMDLIYFFAQENDADGMIKNECKLNW